MPYDPLSGLKKATSISNNDTWIDKVSDFLIGAEGRGQDLLGKAMTGLDQLTYGHNRKEDPDHQAFLDNNNLRGTVTKADTIMGDPEPSMAMAPMGPKDIEGLSTGIKNMYSRVTEAAKTLPEKFHPNKALSHIMNRAGKEEMETRSIANFLKSRGDQPTTRADVTGYLEENPLKVEVKRLGEPRTPFPHADRFNELNDVYSNAMTSDNTSTGWPHMPREDYDEMERLAADNLQYNKAHPTEPTKYGNYTVPGGKNYREDLIKLNKNPSNFEPSNDDFVKWYHETTGQHLDPNLAQSMLEHDDPGIQQYIRERSGPESKAFYTSHWPMDDDVLAHVRHNERYLPNPAEGTVDPASGVVQGPNGPKGRFLEEIQSDWHEKGRDEGYKNPNEENRLKDLGMKVDVAANDLYNFEHNYTVEHGLPEEGSDDYLSNTYMHLNKMLEDPSSFPKYDRLKQDYFRLKDAHEAAQQAYDDARRSHTDAVPDAPFKESWPDLALKQQVLDVAERPDLDWLGFTTGKTQNDRYKLSNHVSRLAFDHDPETNTGVLRAWDPDGREVLTQDVADPKEIIGHIGKDAAARLTSQTPKISTSGTPFGDVNTHSYELTGENLDIGGEGMNTFYDERLPNTLNKILKPFGGQVEKGSIPGPPREFKTGYGTLTGGSDDPVQYYGRVNDATSNEVIANTYPPIPSRAGAVPEARAQAGELAETIRKQTPNKSIPAWIAHLSPEMKKKILEKGLPLMMLMGLTQPSTESQPNQAEEY